MAVNPAVALGGVGVVALGVVGGLYATGTGTSQVEEVRWHALFEDTGYRTTSDVNSDYKDNYGGAYSRYLVGVKESSVSGVEANNDKWWQQTFKNEFVTKKPNIKDKFRKLKEEGKTYSNLKTLCDEAYKAKKSDSNPLIKESVTTDSDTDFQESSIWLFCSPLGKKPSTTKDKDQSTYTGKKGGKRTSNEKYVSVTDKDNNAFWDLKNKEFYDTATTNENSGAKINAEGHFKTAYTNKTHIKDACKAAYEMNEPGQGSSGGPTDADILKYCSLEGK